MPTETKLQPRKAPRQDRSKDTVSAILEATLRLLRTEGMEGLNTNRIAEVAGVGVGSLYQYFPNKEALAGALLEHHLFGVRELFAERMRLVSDAPLEEAARSLIDCVLTTYLTDPKVIGTLESLAPKFGRMWLVHQVRAQVAELAAGLLEKHRTRIRPQNPVWAAKLLVRALDGILLDTLSEEPALLGDPEFREEIAQVALGFLRMPAP